MKTITTGRGILYLLCVLFATILNINAQKKVLFYGPTFNVDNEAAKLLVNYPTEFHQLSSGLSTVWTPGHSTASLDWSRKTTADFEAFDVIVIGDLASDGTLVTTTDPWKGALANVNTWS